MNTYRLVFADDRRGCAKIVEFDGIAPTDALLLMQSESSGRTAELWDGTRCLCRLTRSSDTNACWLVAPPLRT